MKKCVQFLMVGMAIMLGGCGAHEAAQSSVDYSPLSSQYAGLLRKIKNPAITVCIRGFDENDQWATWTVEAVEKWIEPLRALSSEPLAEEVKLVKSGSSECSSADVEVDLRSSYLRAYCQVGSRPYIVVSRQDAREGRVIFHEMGHAFGMGDTYYGPGTQRQPDSVMKTARFNDLQPDDLEGLTFLYNREYNKGKKMSFQNDDQLAAAPVQSTVTRPYDDQAEGELLNACQHH